MGVGQVSIQCQRPLAFGNALSCAIGQVLDGAKQHMGPRMLGSHVQTWIKPCSAA